MKLAMTRIFMGNDINVRKNIEKLDEVKLNFNHGPFSSPKWLEAFENEVLHPISFLFEERGNPIGIIAGLEVHSSNAIARGLRLFKRLFFFTGPVLTNQEQYPECINSLNETAKHLGYVNVIYRSRGLPLQ